MLSVILLWLDSPLPLSRIWCPSTTWTLALHQRFSIPVLAPPRSAYFACLSLLTHLIQIISSLELRSVHELCFRLTCSLHRVHCSLHSVHCSLHRVHCSLHSVHCSLHRVRCSLHSVRCSLHSVHCSLHRVHCSLHSVHCSLHSVHCSLHRVRCSLHSVHCSLHSVHCSLHRVHCSLHRVHCSLHRVHCSLHRVHCSLLPEQGNPLKCTLFLNIHSWICAAQRLHARTSVTSYTSVNIYNFNSRLAHFNALWMEYIRSLQTGIMAEYSVMSTSQGTYVRIEQTSEAIRVTYEICRAGRREDWRTGEPLHYTHCCTPPQTTFPIIDCTDHTHTHTHPADCTNHTLHWSHSCLQSHAHLRAITHTIQKTRPSIV